LKQRGQHVSGKKEELIERILNPEEESVAKVAELKMPEVIGHQFVNAPTTTLVLPNVNMPQVPNLPEENQDEEDDDEAFEESTVDMDEEEDGNGINLPMLPDLGVVGQAMPDLPIVPDAISISHSGIPAALPVV